MEIWQIILLSYIGALVLWLIINALFLLVSMILKKKVFIAVELVTMVVTAIIGIAAGFGDLMLIIWLFTNNYIFWAIIAIVLGLGLVSTVSSVLTIPFALITGAFSAWYDGIEE